eukprot:Awhi_evm1s740
MNISKSQNLFGSLLKNPLQSTIAFSVQHGGFLYTTGRRSKHHQRIQQTNSIIVVKRANQSITSKDNLNNKNNLMKENKRSINYNNKNVKSNQSREKKDMLGHNNRHPLQIYLDNYEDYFNSGKYRDKDGRIKANGELKQHQNALLAYLTVNNPIAARNIFEKIESEQDRSMSLRQSSLILKSLLQVENDEQKGIDFFEWLHKFHPLYCDVNIWTIIVNGLWQRQKKRTSLDYFRVMKREGFTPDKVAYDGAISTCVLTGNAREGMKYYEELKKKGMIPDRLVYHTLIRYYLKKGNVEKGVYVFNDMKRMEISTNVAIYTMLINLYKKMGKVDESIHYFKEMKEMGVSPNVATYSSLIDCYKRQGNLEESVKLFNEMKRNGISPNTVTYTTLIDCYKRQGNLEESFKLFNEMKRNGISPNTVTYNSLIDGINSKRISRKF